MNMHGVMVERRYGRPILAGFHAAFSLGGLAGATLVVLAVAVAALAPTPAARRPAGVGREPEPEAVAA